MTPSRTSIVVIVGLLLVAPSVFAAWHDDYDAGLAAAKRGDWQTVITRMNAAIAQKSSEGRERTYGNIFIEYRPYYYRGVAHFERENFANARADLERTKGPGSLPLGSTDSFLRKIAAVSTPPPPPPPIITPTPTPTPTRPPATVTPTRTVTPTPLTVTPTRGPTPTPIVSPSSQPGDPGTSARLAAQQARGLLTRADDAMKTANERARSPQARQLLATAAKELQLARSLERTARSATDWQRVADAAEGARLQFELIPPEPADDVLEEMRRRVRSALDSYFGGRFSEASAQLTNLTRENRNNGFLWAFLGASRYSEYYIDGERNANLRREAENAFRQARSNGMSELPPAYFSPRIRRFFLTIR